MMPSLSARGLQHVMDLVVQVDAPLEAGQVRGAQTQGQRRIINIVGGTVRGRVNGRVLHGGADYQLITSGTTAVLDARYMLELDDPALAGARVYVHNRALRRARSAMRSATAKQVVIAGLKRRSRNTPMRW